MNKNNWTHSVQVFWILAPQTSELPQAELIIVLYSPDTRRSQLSDRLMESDLFQFLLEVTEVLQMHHLFGLKIKTIFSTSFKHSTQTAVLKETRLLFPVYPVRPELRFHTVGHDLRFLLPGAVYSGCFEELRALFEFSGFILISTLWSVLSPAVQSDSPLSLTLKTCWSCAEPLQNQRIKWGSCQWVCGSDLKMAVRPW